MTNDEATWMYTDADGEADVRQRLEYLYWLYWYGYGK